MAVLNFQRHGRIQEWVAEELGLFKKLGLDYEIAHHRKARGTRPEDEVLSTGDVDGGSSAYRDFVLGSMATNIASTSHWAVSTAIGAGYGKVWPHAYSVMPAGIYVGPDSPAHSVSDLAGTEIVVGRHSGSHFSAIHALRQSDWFSAMKLRFVEGRTNRLRCLLENPELAGSMYGLESYILEQKGYRKLIDTSFMVSFMIAGEANADDVGKYFGALRYAQRAIDEDPARYKHFIVREFPDEIQQLVDIPRCGIGERIVFEAYTKDLLVRTQEWTRNSKILPSEWTRENRVVGSNPMFGISSH